jgi:hypothetical protein
LPTRESAFESLEWTTIGAVAMVAGPASHQDVGLHAFHEDWVSLDGGAADIILAKSFLSRYNLSADKIELA